MIRGTFSLIVGGHPVAGEAVPPFCVPGVSVSEDEKNRGNRSAAPHLRAIGPVDVHGVRGAGPLAQIWWSRKKYLGWL